MTTEDRSLGIAVVGSGGAAGDLCKAIDELAGAHLVAAFDTNSDRSRALAEPRGARTAGSLADVLADRSVDVIYVGLPHCALAPTAEQALLHGKHVLVEKPVGLTTESILRVGRLAAERALQVAGMFVLRESAAVLLAKELVRGGAIGEVRQVRIQTVLDKPEHYWWAGPSGAVGMNWRSRSGEAGGGVMLMNSLHAIDAVRFITGLEFVSAYGETATTSPNIEVEDAAVAAFRLSNQALVSLAAAAHSAGAQRQEVIEIDGSAGRLDVMDSPGRDRVALYLRREWGGHAAGVPLSLVRPTRGLYRETLAAFIGRIHSGKSEATALADAADALAVVLAAYQSAGSGKRIFLSR